MSVRILSSVDLTGAGEPTSKATQWLLVAESSSFPCGCPIGRDRLPASSNTGGPGDPVRL
jgi:hypothetical protein